MLRKEERERERESQASFFLPIQESVHHLPSKPGCGGEWVVPESASLLGDLYSFCQG